MKENIEELKKVFNTEMNQANSSHEIEQLRVKYLGRKGPLQDLMGLLRNCNQEERPLVGKMINELKNELQAAIDQSKTQFEEQELQARLQKERIDVTLPGTPPKVGHKHPLQQTLDEAIEILVSMGFSVQKAPEIESEFYNYGGLNYPEDHPARDMQDTFYIDSETLLRSHTTAIQQRIMEKESPPIRVICPGKCYRNETITARSHVFFYQIDGLYIDKNVTFGDLLATKKEFYRRFFNQDVELRVRPSYFPFVEPGMEIDISCTSCGGEGCSLCKYTGWLEVEGAGMVHPEVLKQGGLNPDEYSGFAWGGGIERICMLRHGIKDIRLFTQNDMRFLTQFP